MKKSEVEWKRDFTMESFNAIVKELVAKEGKKEVIDYFKSWLLFVEKRPSVAQVVFDRVGNEKICIRCR